MKNSQTFSKKRIDQDYEDSDAKPSRPPKEKRRPIRNWTKAYKENEDLVDVIDDFNE